MSIFQIHDISAIFIKFLGVGFAKQKSLLTGRCSSVCVDICLELCEVRGRNKETIIASLDKNTES